MLAALATIAVVTIVVISAWTSSGTRLQPPRTPLVAAKAKARVVVPPPGLVIAVLRGTSYVAVHRGGASGPVLFQGTLGRGEPQSFAGTRFWVNAARPRASSCACAGRSSSSSVTDPS